MQTRAAYLAFQSDIGTDEVVLPQAWRPKSTRIPDPPPAEASRASDSKDFFQTIAQVLTQPTRREAPVSRPVMAPVGGGIPDFANLEEYGAYVRQEYPRWFSLPADTLLAPALGLPRSALAVVELAPETSGVSSVFSGAPGDLLDKMLKAIGLERNSLYLTAVMKTPGPGRGWPRKDVARMLPLMIRELKLAACPWVLLLGEACAQAVLRTGSKLEDLRQRPFEAEGLVFAVSRHPADLQRDETLKRPAWEDLKWLRGRLDAGKA